jgi:hypothetical protein
MTYPVFSDGKVVNHCHNGGNKPDSLGKLASRINGKVAHIRSPIALGFVAKTDKLLCLFIQFRVSRKGHAGQLSVEVLQPDSLKRLWV